MIQEHKEWLTRKEAADYLKVHVVTIWRLERAGKIRSYRMEGTSRPRYSRGELDAAMTQEKGEAEAPPRF